VKPQASASVTNPAEIPALRADRSRLAYSYEGGSLGPGERPAEPYRILLVEDDFLIAMQAETAMVDAGFNVVGVAASADEAIRLAAAQRPVLAVMDIRLAGQRDGVDAALDLFGSHGIRCVFATAHSDPEVVRKAQPAQPLAWLQKPYTMVSLIEAIRAALNELSDPRQ
jgi:DNA-binding NarL/FixJ family response regulator